MANSKLVPDTPGVYTCCNTSGDLSIGKSSSLRPRANQHLDRSDRKSLAHDLREKGNREITIEMYLFGTDTPAKDKTRRRATNPN